MSIGKPGQPVASTTALARHLGLSRWTISRVLNGHPGVREETVQRVREAMKELDFVPNVMARGLRGGRTGLIGLSFQGFEIPIFVRKIGVLQDTLRKAGYRSLIELTDREPDLERGVVGHFASVGVEGIVLVGEPSRVGLESVTGFLAERKIPTVCIDPGIPAPFPTVEVDRGQGMRLVLNHLLELGHTRLALFGLDRSIAYGASRWEGIDAVISERGFDPERNFEVFSEDPEKLGAMDYAYGRRLADRFIHSGRKATAVVALNDQVAVGAMARFREAGLGIPDDLSIVGFDNLEISAHLSPGLTTVDQRVVNLMQAGVKALTRQISAGRKSGQSVVKVEPHLVVRGSTGRVRTN